jgi:CheY-like chemotaxis protein
MNSILILDDDRAALDLLCHFLQQRTRAKIVSARFPTQAIQLASDYCFDFILVDVTIDYNGTQFGGLEVYRALLGRYGNSSMLAYSQYITDELLQRYSLPFNFIEKDTNLVEWVPRLENEFTRLRASQSCFVAMPFHPDLEPIFEAIRSSVESAGYKVVRVDQAAFTKSIVDLIFDEIRRSKFVIFVATQANPNVFFEAGFAIAHGKEVITLTDEFSKLPFDIRDRNAIAYGRNMSDLVNKLGARLAALTKVT